MEKMKLDNLVDRLSASLKALPEKRISALKRISTEIAIAARNRLHVSEKELTALENAVSMRDPDKMLALGWAVVRNASGKAIKSVNSVDRGDRVTVSMQGGTLKVLVEEKK